MAPKTPVTEDQLIRMWHHDGDRQAREQLAERMLPLVRKIAAGYRGRGVDLEDLVQVGAIGLLKAIDRFDPDRGVRLSTYAFPNISGEIKRHFRDHGWAVRMPRELQELAIQATREADSLQGRLGRTPSTEEVAASLNISPGKVSEAMAGSRAYTAFPMDGVEPDHALGWNRRSPGDSFELADVRLTVLRSARGLAERERRIIYLRFFEDQTQDEIAGRVGISQMHVSRLLRLSLDRLAAPDEQKTQDVPTGRRSGRAAAPVRRRPLRGGHVAA